MPGLIERELVRAPPGNRPAREDGIELARGVIEGDMGRDARGEGFRQELVEC